MDSITDSIYNACSPPIVPVLYTMTIEGCNVLVVQIPPGENCPYFIKHEGVEYGTYVRTGAISVRAQT